MCEAGGGEEVGAVCCSLCIGSNVTIDDLLKSILLTGPPRLDGAT